MSQIEGRQLHAGFIIDLCGRSLSISVVHLIVAAVTVVIDVPELESRRLIGRTAKLDFSPHFLVLSIQRQDMLDYIFGLVLRAEVGLDARRWIPAANKEFHCGE